MRKEPIPRSACSKVSRTRSGRLAASNNLMPAYLMPATVLAPDIAALQGVVKFQIFFSGFWVAIKASSLREPALLRTDPQRRRRRTSY